jgi:hypothetical protein
LASANFVVHLGAAVALFIAFYAIAKLRAQNNLLTGLFLKKGAKKLLDPYKTFVNILEFSDIDYETELDSEEFYLMDLSLLGTTLALIEISFVSIMRAGQKTVVVLTCETHSHEIEIEKIKSNLKKATGLEFEINSK